MLISRDEAISSKIKLLSYIFDIATVEAIEILELVC